MNETSGMNGNENAFTSIQFIARNPRYRHTFLVHIFITILPLYFHKLSQNRTTLKLCSFPVNEAALGFPFDFYIVAQVSVQNLVTDASHFWLTRKLAN